MQPKIRAQPEKQKEGEIEIREGAPMDETSESRNSASAQDTMSGNCIPTTAGIPTKKEGTA